MGLGAAVVGAAVWWRVHPSPCPYGQRFWVEAPHPLITRRRLAEALKPTAGETMLEIGPGTGYYSLPVAQALAPAGVLHVLDIQQEMLDHTSRLAGEAGIDNIEPALGDAQELPYGDAMFDAAFLITTLGEIADQDRALAELRRVVTPGGRLVGGELIGDPHMVTARALRARVEQAGWQWVSRLGPPIGYFAVAR